ncbi:MAG: hypothetical protein IJ801_02740 [Lachnospiraceae bacterium]|nr:hypothetical protein [Lachnospiraceae bacterium]
MGMISTNIKKRAALLMCLIVMIVLFFSVYYIAVEEQHHCAGEDCPICAEIELFQNVVRQMGIGVVWNTAVSILLVPFVLKMTAAVHAICIHTLVSQKVRMNH